MNIRFHPHAVERLKEPGATQQEVIETIEYGEKIIAIFGIQGFLP